VGNHLDEIENRSGTGRIGTSFDQSLNPTYSVWSEKNIAADVTNLGGNTINHDHVVPPPQRLNDQPALVLTATPL
jgi:hypothetical protein